MSQEATQDRAAHESAEVTRRTAEAGEAARSAAEVAHRSAGTREAKSARIVLKWARTGEAAL